MVCAFPMTRRDVAEVAGVIVAECGDICGVAVTGDYVSGVVFPGVGGLTEWFVVPNKLAGPC